MSEDKALGQEMVNDQVESDSTQETKSDNKIGELVYEAKKHRQDKAKLREELISVKAQLKDIDEAQLKEKEQYKELSERLSQERDTYKSKADEYDNFQGEMRSNLMEKLSDEQKEIATDLPLNKLQKFVDMNVKEKPAATQETASTNMNLQQEPFTDMSKDQRRKNWKSIVDSYK